MRLYRQSELRTLPRPKFLIKNWLLEHSLGQISGSSGAGKTFIYTDWCCRLAAEGRRVLIILGEGLYRYQTRLDAWQKHHGIVVPNDNLIVLPDVPALPNIEQMRATIAAVKPLGTLDLIMIDTFAKSMAGYNEQENSDVTVALANLCELRRVAGDAAGYLVTHFGWTAERQRGASSLYGECDTVIYLKKVARKAVEEKEEELDSLGYLNQDEPPKSRRVRLVLDKQRDAPDDIPSLLLERTDIDLDYLDPDGNLARSCVYLPVTVAKKASTNGQSNGHADVLDLTDF